MNKQDFINKYALKTEQNKKDSAKQVEIFLETLRESLMQEKKVSFIGDWSMELVDKKERKGVNPATREEMIIPASVKIKFKVGKILKNLLN